MDLWKKGYLPWLVIHLIRISVGTSGVIIPTTWNEKLCKKAVMTNYATLVFMRIAQ